MNLIFGIMYLCLAAVCFVHARMMTTREKRITFYLISIALSALSAILTHQ